MMQTLSYFPGQIATILLETKDADGYRAACISDPIVTQMILPTLELADGYPQSMIEFDTGIYYYQFTLPTGYAAVGNYIADVEYMNPATNSPSTELYQIIITAPFGNYGISIG